MKMICWPIVHEWGYQFTITAIRRFILSKIYISTLIVYGKMLSTIKWSIIGHKHPLNIMHLNSSIVWCILEKQEEMWQYVQCFLKCLQMLQELLYEQWVTACKARTCGRWTRDMTTRSGQLKKYDPEKACDATTKLLGTHMFLLPKT